MATRPTPTDSWLNGYQQDVGFLLDLLTEQGALREALERIERREDDDPAAVASNALEELYGLAALPTPKQQEDERER